MINDHVARPCPFTRLAAVACGALLLTTACASSDADDAAETEATSADTDPDTTVEGADAIESETTAPDAGGAETTSSDVTTTEPAVVEVDGADDDSADDESADADSAGDDSVGVTAGCDDVAALFVTRGSANADLDDPEVSASCEGDDVVITSNGIPDYTYIETSPGQPRDQDNTFTIPATPTVADEVTAVPIVGTSAVTLGGIQIFGPTEGTGGDVESLPGILSDCGSHNGPSGFHIHLILTTSETDCLFTPEEVAAEPQLVGYAFDGFPIYTGIDQYTSSWELTDESLFATDTWAAHSYVEGSGDLDECNGLTDADGNYAYYTTETFPYIMGCYTGVVDLDAAGGGGGGGGGDEGERPERDAGDDDRPEPPEGDDGEALADGAGDEEGRPERPVGEAGVGEDRPERPDRPASPDGGAAPPEGDDG